MLYMRSIKGYCMKKILLMSLGLAFGGLGMMHAMENDIIPTATCLVPSSTTNFLQPDSLMSVAHWGPEKTYSDRDSLQQGQHYLVRDEILRKFFITFIIMDVTPKGFVKKFYKHTLDGVNSWISPSNSFVEIPERYDIKTLKGYSQKCQQRQEQKQLAFKLKQIKQCKNRK